MNTLITDSRLFRIISYKAQLLLPSKNICQIRRIYIYLFIYLINKFLSNTHLYFRIIIRSGKRHRRFLIRTGETQIMTLLTFSEIKCLLIIIRNNIKSGSHIRKHRNFTPHRCIRRISINFINNFIRN